jgi:hypothetical protein
MTEPSPDIPPPSVRASFSLVQRSDAMMLFVERVESRAASRRMALRIIPVDATDNMLEVDGLFQVFLKPYARGGPTLSYSEPPTAHQLERGGATAVLLLQGDALDDEAQDYLLRRQSPTYVLAMVNTSRPNAWSEGFKEAARDTLHWPSWKKRRDDRAELIGFMHGRLRMPKGGAAPALDDNARSYLLTREFKGTDDANAELKRGLTVYISRGSTGPLAIEHFTGSQSQRALHSRGDIRRSPLPPPVE